MAATANKRKFQNDDEFDSEDTATDFQDSDSEFDESTFAMMKSSSNNLRSVSRRSQIQNGGLRKNNQQIIERKPTRKPNPKISNRNALLARENRLRKKQYVEELEQSVEQMQQENKRLRQMMKKKNGEIAILEKDRCYLKSILVNKTEIFSILKTIQNTRIPITHNGAIAQRSTQNDYKRSSSLNSWSASTSSESHEENNDFGLDMDGMTPQSINGWDALFPESEIETKPAHVYCTESDTNKTSDSHKLDESYNFRIASEHNYFESDQKSLDDSADSVQQPGICLHITNNRVSLEFCASCHVQAQSPSWIDDEEL